MREQMNTLGFRKKKIWIDMDNSPHVPFFVPIIRELEKHGYEVTLTARDSFQVCGLADLYNLKYKKIGHHYGKKMILKILGTLIRSVQLMQHGIRERPVLSFSHGVRSLMIASKILKIPNVTAIDYEHGKGVPFIASDWSIIPEIVFNSIYQSNKRNILTYPGIKEDVFVNDFKPSSDIREKLGLGQEDIVVTIRPPATEAHYHNNESEILYDKAVEILSNHSMVKMVILPRNEKSQTEMVKKKWPKLMATGKIIIPNQVVNGLDLIWHSDLLISGGGSMNREAAVLGVPAYSIFRGKIGAVDQYLSERGRLILIKNVTELKSKLKIIRRSIPENTEYKTRPALEAILDHLFKILDRL